MSWAVWVEPSDECRWVTRGWLQPGWARQDLVLPSREECVAWLQRAFRLPGVSYTVKEYAP